MCFIYADVDFMLLKFNSIFLVYTRDSYAVA